MKKEIIVLLFALSNMAGMSYSQELVGTKITIKDAWDNVFRSSDDGRNYELIGTYRGWNKDAVYIAGYNYSNIPSYYSTKYISFGGSGVERLWVDLLSGNVGIGTTKPTEALETTGNIKANSGGLISSKSNIDIGGYLSLDNPAKTGNGQASMWRIYNMGGGYGNSLQFWAYDNIGCASGGMCSNRFTILDNGNVGIGTLNPAHKLDVLGTIRAKEVLVNLDGGADFVFEKDYKLPTIEHVATYVQANKHLPDIPSATEMTKNGVSMGDMQVKLLQKVEELTLYAIQQNKKIENQETDRKILEAKLSKQENQYNALLEKVETLTKQIEKK